MTLENRLIYGLHRLPSNMTCMRSMGKYKPGEKKLGQHRSADKKQAKFEEENQREQVNHKSTPKKGWKRDKDRKWTGTFNIKQKIN